MTSVEMKSNSSPKVSEMHSEIKTLKNLLDIMTEAEATAVARYVPIMEENNKLRSENANLRQRNNVLENALSDMSEAAQTIVAVKF